MKHFSHYLLPGARLLETTGANDNLMAFVNPDRSIVLIVRNPDKSDKQIIFKVDNQVINPVLKADSFNTLIVR
jgi:glucosylceramidase